MMPKIKELIGRRSDPEIAAIGIDRAADIEIALRSRRDLDPDVIEASIAVSRREFVPHSQLDRSAEDRALSIGHGQTISQPSLVAHMITQLRLPAGARRVLDVGCGSGYQAAILSLLAQEVVAVERVKELADAARSRLARLGYHNVDVRDVGDDDLGYFASAPYDGVIVGAAAPRIPSALAQQLKIGARLVIPVGKSRQQRLAIVTREGESDSKFSVCLGLECVFVPLVAPDHWFDWDVV